MRVALVGCSKSKLTRRALARDLYTSALFRRARAVAEQTCDRWLILSAKYGVVEPTTELDPYDVELTAQPADYSLRWKERAATRIIELVPVDAVLVLLAGHNYDPGAFLWGMRASLIERPLVGLGIGARLAKLGALLREGRS